MWTYNDFTNDRHFIRTWVLKIYFNIGDNAHCARAEEQAVRSISLTVYVESYFTLATERSILQSGGEHEGRIHEIHCGGLQLISSWRRRRALTAVLNIIAIAPACCASLYST